ncbi:hypothetical protein CTZ27_29745 [Streptomyces griseocarneus]|nr:hypothetical protein CTZ27_29745 [Streptomyces griseocarneus]
MLFAKSGYRSCHTLTTTRELGRWLGLSESAARQDVLPPLVESDAVRYRVTEGEWGQTTGLDCVVMPVWRARCSGEAGHPLALSRRELAVLLRVLEALFAPGWGPDERGAGLLAGRGGRGGKGSATDRLAALLLVLEAREDGTVPLVGGRLPKGRGRAAATVARLLGCSASGGAKVLSRLRSYKVAATDRRGTGSGLKGKALLVLPPVVAAQAASEVASGTAADAVGTVGGVVCGQCGGAAPGTADGGSEPPVSFGDDAVAGAGEVSEAAETALAEHPDGAGRENSEPTRPGALVAAGESEVGQAEEAVIAERPAGGPLHADHPHSTTADLEGAGGHGFSGEADSGCSGRPGRARTREEAPPVVEQATGDVLPGGGDGSPLRGENRDSSSETFLPLRGGVRDACSEGLAAWAETTGGAPRVWAPVPRGWEELLAPVAMVWGRLERLSARATVHHAVRRELNALDGLFGPGRGTVLLGARLRRRAAEQGRRPVKDPVGWLMAWAIPRRAACPDVRCDDGRRMDTGSSCERCAEHHGDLVARRRAVGIELGSVLGGKVASGEYRRLYEARLAEATGQAERKRATSLERAAVEHAQLRDALDARRAEQAVFDEQQRARPCVVCGRERSGGLCGICDNARAAEAAVAEAVEIGLAAREHLGTAAGEAELCDRVEGEVRVQVRSQVDQAVAEGATELTASVLGRLAAEQQRSVIRQEAVRLFAMGPEAGAEAEAASAARMRSWHLHECDGQHDCRAFVREEAERVAETARRRTAEHLLEQRLAAVRAQRAALPVPVEADPYRVAAARVRAAIRRPHAEAAA